MPDDPVSGPIESTPAESLVSVARDSAELIAQHYAGMLNLPLSTSPRELTDERSKVPIYSWAPIVSIEPAAQAQLLSVAALPWVYHHVAVMPDVHYGKGATVGSVIAMKNAVAPAAVGVDIGCGMSAVKTNVSANDLPESLLALRHAIEGLIPVGFKRHDGPVWPGTRHAPEAATLLNCYKDLDEGMSNGVGLAECQLGTLGGGNHFIEICLDEQDCVWLMLHSGSRAAGKILADIHIGRAMALTHNRELPDPILSVFLAGTPEMAAYRHDLSWAQQYALINRRIMVERVKSALEQIITAKPIEYQPTIDCHHNYVAEERHFGEQVLVTRKGAIRAGLGELGIIPGSMGTKSYIVSGLGNRDSFESAAHGAGRRMSRGAARRKFTVADLEKQTAGVECRKDAGVVDEIPGSYKSIEEVMAQQADLVCVEATLRQIVCVKG